MKPPKKKTKPASASARKKSTDHADQNGNSPGSAGPADGGRTFYGEWITNANTKSIVIDPKTGKEQYRIPKVDQAQERVDEEPSSIPEGFNDVGDMILPSGMRDGRFLGMLRIPSITREEFNRVGLELNKTIRAHVRPHPDGTLQCIIMHKNSFKQVERYLMLREIMPAYELEGAKFAAQAEEYIQVKEGCFLLGVDRAYHIILGGRRYPINAESRDFQEFFKDACGITTRSQVAGVAIQHLDILAHKQASKMVMRGFSTMYEGSGAWGGFLSTNPSRVYVPVTEPGKILQITPSEISLVPNGKNQDQVWLEHPESNPFTWTKPVDLAEVRAALGEFERLLVYSQSCKPELAWFVAMAEGVFPLVRDITITRFIVLHRGAHGHGKTFPAKQAMVLHGFDIENGIKFDASAAALGNKSEQGILVVDNKEAKDFTQDLINFLLRMATGGARERSDQDRKVHSSAPRPVTVVTSIEGVPTPELNDRCLEVKYVLSDDTPRLDDRKYHKEMADARDRIMCAMVCVIEDYLWIRTDPGIAKWVESFTPIDRFKGHFWEVCYLLIAYARIMKHTRVHGVYEYQLADEWAMEQIRVWDREIRRARGGTADSADGATGTTNAKQVSSYEDPILHIIQTKKCEMKLFEDFEYPKGSGKRGTCYAFITSALHGALNRERQLFNLEIPPEVRQFGSRIRAEHFQRFRLLDQSDGVPGSSLGQRIGVWIPKPDGPAEPPEPVVSAQPAPEA
jgi:hypothetical protein